MASGALYDTDIDLCFIRADGSTESCFTGTGQQTGAGGSPDGVIATALTANASWHLPLILKPAPAGSRLMVKFKLNTSDGVDKSDCAMVLPITIKDLSTGKKTVKIIKGSDMGTITDLPAGSITGVWYEFGTTGFAVQAGQEICWGASPSIPSFLSIENDS